MPPRRCLTMLLVAPALFGACSGGDGSNRARDAAGGAATGGVAPAGGTPTGGAVQGSGGRPLDGTVSGGALTGGARPGGEAATGGATGGTSMGGADFGGTATGGTATGGTATAGADAGGTATGGTATAGADSGGGTATGGGTLGGAATAGTDAGGGTTAGTEAGGAAGSAPGAAAPGVEKQGESMIALSGLTVVSYGGYLNGESFQQDGILTSAGYQYSAFWNTNRQVVLARRRLPDGPWEKFDFTDYTNTEDDAHNTISLGVCPGDGTLHLAFDHHDSDLHYRRSVPGLTTDPENVPWTAASFTSVADHLVSGAAVSSLTYPRFVTEPGGRRLLLAARLGASGSGNEALWEYDSDAQEWRDVGEFIDGITDSVNAYLHGLAYTRGGDRLHAAWCWRETPDATTNHDLFYAYSDDHGRTWMSNAGDRIATSGSAPISRDTVGASVWSIGQNRGLINQEHLAVDAAGRVHVLLSHLPDSAPDDANFTSARTRTEYFHYWRDTDGTWSRGALGLASIENFRGKLAVASSGNVYAVLPDLRIAAASVASGYTDWALLDASESGRFFSDPLIDTTRLEQEDVLTVYFPEASSPNVVALDYAVQ